MINILIADDNLSYVKNLSNYLSANYSNIRIANISTNGLEIIDYISKNTVDLILLDLDMPILDGIHFLKEIKNSNLQEVPKIIVISCKLDKFYILKNDPIVSLCISKLDGFDIIGKSIEEITEQTCYYNVIKENIISELKIIGFNLKHNGSIYLIESILWIYFHPSSFSNLEKNVYSVISKKTGKSVYIIKSNILKSINYMYVENDFKKLQEYFSLYEDIKPTPKTVIMTVLNKL